MIFRTTFGADPFSADPSSADPFLSFVKMVLSYLGRLKNGDDS